MHQLTRMILWRNKWHLIKLPEGSGEGGQQAGAEKEKNWPALMQNGWGCTEDTGCTWHPHQLRTGWMDVFQGAGGKCEENQLAPLLTSLAEFSRLD
jgi:hypothetical protein